MKQDHYPQMYDLASYSFNFGEKTDKEVNKFNEMADGSWNYGLFENDQLISQIMATPFDVDLHGGKFKMIGIGYVSTYPEARGNGAVNRLMTKILQDANDRRIDLSYLAPFSYDFYEKYGYRLIFHRVHYKVQNEKFRFLQSYPGTIKRQSYDEIKPDMIKVFNKMPRNKKGGVIRNSWWVDYKFGNKELQFASFFNENEDIEGYLVYQFDDEHFVIKDLGFLTFEALSSLLCFCQSHSGTFRDFIFSTGFHEPFFDELSNDIFSTQMSISPDMMARIINLERFIQKYPFKKDLTFTLEVTEDKFAAWNSGGYQVTIREGKAKISRIESVAYDISGNIQAYTELFMGSKKPSELLFQKSISGKEAFIRHFDAAVYSQPPVLEEYF